MAGTVDIEIQGSEEIVAKLQNMANLEKLTPAVNKALAKVERTAKRTVPVKTGDLRKSIHVHSAKVSRKKIVGWVYTAKEYAAYVEFGTGVRGDGSYDRQSSFKPTYKPDWAGQQAQPYLYPALKNNTDYTKKVINSAVRALAKGES